MHPLAVPIVVVGLSFAAVTVTATLELGSPLRMHRVRSGRAVIAAAVVVYAAAIALWTLREFSLFGGPVPV